MKGRSLSASTLDIAELGTPFDVKDQGRAMIIAGLCLFCFVFFHACADLSDPTSILAGLTRFAGVASAVAMVIVMQFALPPSMRSYKVLIVMFGCIGALAQFLGVNQLMQAQAEVTTFLGFQVAAQIFYLVTLLTTAICIFKHRFLPNWLAFTLIFAELVWAVRYFSIAFESTPKFISAMAWGPGIVAELASCVGFIYAGIQMRRAATIDLTK